MLLEKPKTNTKNTYQYMWMAETIEKACNIT